jgi:hypothetical protein
MSAPRSRTSIASPSATLDRSRPEPRTLHDTSRAHVAEAAGVVGYLDPEETLVVDARAGLRPAQWVEHKLCGLLKSELLPVSQVRLTAPTCSREHC